MAARGSGGWMIAALLVVVLLFTAATAAPSNGMWQPITLASGLSPAPGYEVPAMMLMDDIVYLRGRITASSLESRPLFTLPAAYRPPAQLSYACGGSVSAIHNRVDVKDDGTVNLSGAAPGETSVSLDSIIFSTSGMTDTDWQAAELTAGHVAHVSSSNWQAPSFRMVGDIVYIRGLVRRQDGQTLTGIVFKLPANMRPALAVAFLTVAHAGTTGTLRVDIRPDGDVVIADRTANSQYAQLDGIHFVPSSAVQTFDNLIRGPGIVTGPSSWTYPSFRIVDNRVELRGLAQKSTGDLVTGDIIGRLFEGTRPAQAVAFSVVAHKGGAGQRIEARPDGNIVVTGAVGSSRYVELDGVSFFAPAVSNSLIPLPLEPPFVAVPSADGYAPPAFIRRHIDVIREDNSTGSSMRVSLQGLVLRSPSTTAGRKLGTLPLGFRPANSLSFPTMALTGDDTVYRVDVYADGSVTLGAEAETAVNVGLDTIEFSIDTASTNQFRTIELAGEYTPQGSGWQVPQLSLSTDKRVFLRGLARRKSGNVAQGDVIFTLAEGMRPASNLAFTVISHRNSEVHRLDVRPDGSVVAAAAYPSPYVSLDGVSFAIAGAEAEWTSLLDTAHDDKITAYAELWTVPSYKVDGDRLYLRGLATTRDRSPLPDGALLGTLPGHLKPHFAHSYPGIAHDSNAVQHVEVTAGGEVIVDAARGSPYASLDGISYAIRRHDYWLGAWTVVSDGGDDLLLQVNNRRSAAGMFAADGSLVFAGYTGGRAPPEWKHSPGSLMPGVFRLGNWLIGPRDPTHFVISHALQGATELPPFLVRHDSLTWIEPSLASKTTPEAKYSLDDRAANVVVVGNYVFGPHPTDEGVFVVQRLGNAAPTFVIFKDGKTQGGPWKTVPGAQLSALSYLPWLGPAETDAAADGTLIAGSDYVVGARNDNGFFVNHRGEASPALGVLADGTLTYYRKALSTNAALRLTQDDVASGAAVAMGNWLLGQRGDTLVLNTLTGSGPPQLTLSRDGVLSTASTTVNGAAPAEWSHRVGGSNTVRLGNWLMGAKNDDHFVINRIGAGRPQFLIRDEGALWLAGQYGPISSSYVLRPTLSCSPDSGQELLPFTVAADWMLGAKNDHFSATSRAASVPGLVIEAVGAVTISQRLTPADLPGDLRVRASDPGAVQLGPWVVGFKGPDFFVINQVDDYEDTAPQLVIRSDGTLYVNSYAPKASSGYSHTDAEQKAKPTAVLRVGNWFFGAVDSKHFVINSEGAPFPELLIRNDGKLFAEYVYDSLDQQAACALELECHPGDWRNDNGDGIPTCSAATNCLAGSYVTVNLTTTSDRECGPCADGTFSTQQNALACAPVSSCVVNTTYETRAPSTSHDRECSACSVCPAGTHHQLAACTLMADTQCNDCRVCSPDATDPMAKGFEFSSCTNDTNTVCKNCTVCDSASSYESAPCTAGEDTTCAPLTVCDSESYESRPSDATSDRACTPLTVCTPGEQESTAPTSTSDRVCRLCASGTTDDDRNGSTPCVPCAVGFYAAAGSVGECVLYACQPGTADLDMDPSTPCQSCALGQTFQPNSTATTCFNVTECDTTVELEATRTADAICTPPPKSAASASASTAATAGAAGGAAVLLIVLVIVVVLRRRGSGKAKPRDTVSFENPIYDEQASGADAAYDGVGDDGGAEEGMYSNVVMDEPSDMLDGGDDPAAFGGFGEDQDEAGYLDVTD